MLKKSQRITNINNHLAQALFHRNNKDFDDAIFIYQELIILQPNNPVFYDELAQTQAQKAIFTEAIVNYQKALELGIKSKFWTYKNLGDALRQKNRLEEAITAYKNALNLDANNPDVYDTLGQVQSLKQNFAEAINYYQKALELNIKNPIWTYKNLGDALRRENRLEEAISAYQKAFKLQPDNSLKVREFLEIDTLSFPENKIVTYSETEALELQETAANNHNIIQNQERLFPDLDDKSFIEHIYAILLGRKVDKQGLEGNLEALKNNVPRRVVLENLLQTQEFLSKHKQHILDNLDNRQFVHIFWQLLLGRACDPAAEQSYTEHLENGLTRIQFISEITKSNEFKERINNLELLLEKQAKNTASVWIMGTDKYISQNEWDETLLKILCFDCNHKNNNLDFQLKQNPAISQVIQQYSSLTNTPLVSIITSLYKGKDFIEHFLENITNQTIFNFSELIIIDANSPEKEFDIIKKYMIQFDNIRYIRTEQVIGIYEAWNIGIELAKGRFLTNANLDDLRRFDCLEKQAEVLLKHKDIDIVYQDFYYSMTPNLPFEIIEKCDYKSQLPPKITRENMLQFNSPHNAPMWRKSLHRKIGLFNTCYRSAGDYELWMRALLNKAQFLKIEEPTVAYYNNPSGISTRIEGHGQIESKEIQAVYQTLFTKSLFALSQGEFIKLCREKLGLTGNIKTIESSTKNWQKKLLLLDKCFIQKLQDLIQHKFYLPLNNVPVDS